MKELDRFPKKGDIIKRVYPDCGEWIVKILKKKIDKHYRYPHSQRKYDYQIIKCKIYVEEDEYCWSGESFVFSNGNKDYKKCKDYLLDEEDLMVEML